MTRPIDAHTAARLAACADFTHDEMRAALGSAVELLDEVAAARLRGSRLARFCLGVAWRFIGHAVAMLDTAADHAHEPFCRGEHAVGCHVTCWDEVVS